MREGARGDNGREGCAWRSLIRFEVRVGGRMASWERLRSEEKEGGQALLSG